MTTGGVLEVTLVDSEGIRDEKFPGKKKSLQVKIKSDTVYMTILTIFKTNFLYGFVFLVHLPGCVVCCGTSAVNRPYVCVEYGDKKRARKVAVGKYS